MCLPRCDFGKEGDTHRPLAGGYRRVYLDLDGVVADFFGYARRALGAEYRALPPELAWQELGRVPRLYRQLAPLAGARELYTALFRIGPVAILSATPLPSGLLYTASADKRAWVRQHLGNDTQVITVCGAEQKAMFASPDALLIDDSMRNVVAWKAAGGEAIAHVSVVHTMRLLGLATE